MSDMTYIDVGIVCIFCIGSESTGRWVDSLKNPSDFLFFGYQFHIRFILPN